LDRGLQKIRQRQEDAERTPLREVQGFVWDGPKGMVVGIWELFWDWPVENRDLEHMTQDEFQTHCGRLKAAIEQIDFSDDSPPDRG
jgi:hypothetical protein